MHLYKGNPKPPQTLDELILVSELYYHLVKAGNSKAAINLYYKMFGQALHFQFGNYALEIELLGMLFEDNFEKTDLDNQNDICFVLNQLSIAYGMIGQPQHSMWFMEKYLVNSEPLNNEENIAIGLGNLAIQQIATGALHDATGGLLLSINLCEKFGFELTKPNGYQELGRLFSYLAEWQDSDSFLRTGLDLCVKQENFQGAGIVLAYRAMGFLLYARSNFQSRDKYLNYSIDNARRTLELSDEWQKQIETPNPVNYIIGYWVLGAAYRMNNELTLAEENLSKALNLCRQTNNVMYEADILLDLAWLRYAQSDFKDAQEKASEALVITERSGYVLQGADVHLFLAELAMSGQKSQVEGQLSDKEAARKHAEEALRLATCDGGEYTYKVAYDEAERMLARLKAE